MLGQIASTLTSDWHAKANLDHYYNRACTKLSKLESSKRRNFGADSFVAQFQLVMRHLKDTRTSYPLQLQKTTFLDKIKL